MKYFLLIASLYSASAFSSTCSPIPARADGKKIQTFKSLTGEDEQRGKYESSVYGPDLIYQGENCPAGKICIESVYTIYGNLGTTHGQVVVLDQATGNVEQILPLRTQSRPAPQGQALSVSGIAPLDPERVNRVCQEIRKEGRNGPLWCGRPDRDTNVPNLNDRENLDTYAYGIYQGRRLVSGAYVPLTEESRGRVIQALNSGNRTNRVAYITPQFVTNYQRTPRDPNAPVDWSQVASIQAGSKGTVSRLARLVGTIRESLRCEPTATNPEIRLRQATLDARSGLEACGLKYDIGNGIDAYIRCETAPCSSGRAQLTRPLLVNLTQKSSSEYECKSKFRGDVETITCKYQDVKTKYEQEFRIQNGRLLGVGLKDSSQRGEYVCNVAEAAPRSRSERRSGSRVQSE